MLDGMPLHVLDTAGLRGDRPRTPLKQRGFAAPAQQCSAPIASCS